MLCVILNLEMSTALVCICFSSQRWAEQWQRLKLFQSLNHEIIPNACVNAKISKILIF